ncbi:MAG: beta-galactosidase trimerization domain-containing protein [Clostridia bacterium]|nr:beta-galactosidase trimerization domain-containing protein [Clostridia bacterium]
MNFRQVHLDFHTSEKIDGIGTHFSKKQFQEALKIGHVNSITVFSKCHHGWAYHPSDANKMHPGLKFDLLKEQIDAAHEIGVKTPVYLSAGLDEKIAKEHPEWIVYDRIKPTDRPHFLDFSEPGYHILCMNTPYLPYLLAQIKEVCERYDADGIFLDIVGVRVCSCPTCVAQLIREGKDPSKEENLKDLAERVYANYCKKVRETIDSVKPGLPVFHNGGHIIHGRRDLAHFNTHLELESLPTGGWGYDHFPLSARYAQGLGMEFLGMTGKFHTSWGEFGGFKHKNALRYEVALSAAFGAKSSIGDQLTPNGEMDLATYKLIGAAYKELEEKEPWLDNVTPKSDIALFSTEAVKKVSNASAGAVRILLEGHYLFDVVDSESDIDEYKVLILPDNTSLDENFQKKIRSFIDNGGKILASGKSVLDKNTDKFIFDLGAEYISENEYCPDYLRPDFEIPDMDTSDYIIYAKGYKCKTTGKELASRRNPFFNRTAEHFCSHQHAPSSGEYGGAGITKGNDGIYISWEIFSEYASCGSLISKRVVMYALDNLLGEEKTITTNLPAQGVVSLMEQVRENRLVCHMLYVVPVKRGMNIEIIEDIVPVFNIDVKIKTDKKIKNVYLAPTMESLPFESCTDSISFTVPKVDCSQLIVLEY